MSVEGRALGRMPAVPLSPEQSIRQMLQESEQFKAEIQQQQRTIESMRKEIEGQNDKLEKLKQFEPLLEEPPKFLTVYIRDGEVIQRLRGFLLKTFSKKLELDADDPAVRKRAAGVVSEVVEVCLDYCITLKKHEIRSRISI